MPNHKLAVVIPAFKPDFLAKSLNSLLQQTDQRFDIYIGDDASPADLLSITRTALGARTYTYKRFESNLGGVSLAKHWERCLALSTEPWVWLFSDDDLMDPNCVEAFYKYLQTNDESTDLLRFEAWVVDGNDKVLRPHIFDPDQESWLEFTYGYLMNWRWSIMQKLIFRRCVFEEAGGFLDLPLCWNTDDAAVIALGRYRPIHRIKGARVFWRSSGQNISPDRSAQARSKKLRAACLLLQWLQRLLQLPREHLFEGDEAAFSKAMDRFLVEQILNQGFLPAMVNWNLLSRTRVQICNGSRWSLLKFIAVAAVDDGMSAIGKVAKMLAGRFIK